MKPSLSFQKVKTDKDIADTARLARKIWTEHFSDMIGREIVMYLLDKFQSEEAVTQQIRDGYFYFLIKAENDRIGYFAVQHQKEMKNMFLSKLYILSSERGKGHGKNTMRFIEKMACEKQCRKISLTVFHKNAGSIAAYEKMGFQKTGNIRRDVGNDIIIHDITMEKILVIP